MKPLRILAALLAALVLALPATSHADVQDGSAPSDGRPDAGKVGAGWDGTTHRVFRMDPTGRLLMSLPPPSSFYGAGITSDTTTNVSNLVATQTTCCGYADIESAPWSTANLYPRKSIYIKVNSTTGSTGSYVFRIQGSNLGTDGTWNDILLPAINQGTAIATPETLQFVAGGTGAPFLGGFKVPLNSVVSAATGTPVWNDPLGAYAWLRVIVLNRSNSTTTGLNYTVKWEGSQ